MIIKYYADTDGNIHADPVNTDGMEEVSCPVSDCGGVLPCHEKINTLKTNECGEVYKKYNKEPDENGIYQPDTETINAEAKAEFKSIMKSCSETHCCSGVFVTVTVDETDYTGLFYPEDKILENASGVALYRETVDGTADQVPMGDYWYTKDESGNDISIPMTETLLQKIMVAVKNWQVSCSRVYNERKRVMLEMDDVSEFDPESDMTEHLPSRYITIV